MAEPRPRTPTRWPVMQEDPPLCDSNTNGRTYDTSPHSQGQPLLSPWPGCFRFHPKIDRAEEFGFPFPTVIHNVIQGRGAIQF
ncbi:unnamed protein product [Nezara viridula]|uniref:Uncharacterized protein n=1 Tax=Nezara viridula TaxID=85310 RepID=A0A9P0MZG2_NEZVI|nr:unnamed protein product [Nezara viridula]